MASAKPKTTDKQDHKGSAKLPKSAHAADLSGYLLARAPAEDTAAYEPAMLMRAAELAGRAVASHRKGDSIVAIDREAGIVRDGRPVTVITVVNDNMPFLFDSVLGEITESGRRADARHPSGGRRCGTARRASSEILADGSRQATPAPTASASSRCMSSRLSPDEADGLKERLAKVLGQVRAAVDDWKPMLARLDHAISDFRYAPVPLDKDAVTEAIAFLEWLRDDNFTFLGMREFQLFRRREERHARRAATSAGPRHPRRSGRAGAAARQRGGDRRRPKSAPSCMAPIR